MKKWYSIVMPIVASLLMMFGMQAAAMPAIDTSSPFTELIQELLDAPIAIENAAETMDGPQYAIVPQPRPVAADIGAFRLSLKQPWQYWQAI